MQKIIMKPVCETACSISHFIFIYHSASRADCTPCPVHPTPCSRHCKEQREHDINWISMRTWSFGSFYNFYRKIIIIYYWPLLIFPFLSQYMVFHSEFISIEIYDSKHEAHISLGTRKFHLERYSAIQAYEVQSTISRLNDVPLSSTRLLTHNT